MMMMTILLATQALAHDSTDWRLDWGAYRSARVVERVPPSARSFESYPIDPAYLRTKLSELSGVRPVPGKGRSELILERGSEAGKLLARDFLRREYERLGYVVSLHHYDFGFNFVAEKRGSDGARTLLLTSHLDSVRNPGADDNGAGTISALAVARSLSRVGFKHSLRIVAFDQEEQGLIGSRNYVESLTDGASLIGAINMEMTAYNSRADGHFHVMDCDRADSGFLSGAIMEAVEALDLGLTRVAACTERSDHAWFWRKGIPAVVVSQNFFGGDSNPCYHKACDTVEKLDFGYMARITAAIASASAALLEKSK